MCLVKLMMGPEKPVSPITLYPSYTLAIARSKIRFARCTIASLYIRGERFPCHHHDRTISSIISSAAKTFSSSYL